MDFPTLTPGLAVRCWAARFIVVLPHFNVTTGLETRDPENAARIAYELGHDDEGRLDWTDHAYMGQSIRYADRIMACRRWTDSANQQGRHDECRSSRRVPRVRGGLPEDGDVGPSPRPSR